VTISQPHDLYRPGQVIWLDEAKANTLIERQRATRLVTSMPLTRVTFLVKVDSYNAGETAGFAPERARHYVEQQQAFYAGPPVIPVRFTTDYDLYTQGEDAWLMETVANHYVQSGLAERVDPGAPVMTAPGSGTLLATTEPSSPAPQEQTSASLPLMTRAGMVSEVAAPGAEQGTPAAGVTAETAVSPQSQQTASQRAEHHEDVEAMSPQSTQGVPGDAPAGTRDQQP
jgi:hypothetical protein